MACKLNAASSQWIGQQSFTQRNGSSSSTRLLSAPRHVTFPIQAKDYTDELIQTTAISCPRALHSSGGALGEAPQGDRRSVGADRRRRDAGDTEVGLSEGDSERSVLFCIAEHCKLLRKLHIDGWRTNRIGNGGLFAASYPLKLDFLPK